MKRLIYLALVAIVTASLPLNAQARTRNVVLIVTDGLRWQEVFGGAERRLMSRAPGGVSDTVSLIRDFWRDTPEARREALLPFVWGTVAKQGIIYGNARAGSIARITNTYKFSYPGYNELFTGAFDPRIDSNGYPPNPNETVFEWLAAKPAFAGKVAAVATWATFTNIFNAPRSRFPIIAGWNPPFASKRERSAEEVLIDELYEGSVKYWPENTFDAPMQLAAKQLIRNSSPRVMFVGYGETDEWAHGGRYDLLLRSARQVDAFISDLWTMMQGIPQYRDSTTFIITTDHGRGSGESDWKDHGEDVAGAENIWIAMIGPDTPAGGEVKSGIVTQSQIAATIATLLGEDWNSRNPRAGRPLTR